MNTRNGLPADIHSIMEKEEEYCTLLINLNSSSLCVLSSCRGNLDLHMPIYLDLPAWPKWMIALAGFCVMVSSHPRPVHIPATRVPMETVHYPAAEATWTCACLLTLTYLMHDQDE